MQDYIRVYSSTDAPDTSGSSLKGHLSYGISYDMLIEVLGEPTHLSENSVDGKVNFEWVVDFNDDVFYIYDWKTESPEWSILNTGTKAQASEWFGGSRWHIGGKVYAGDFIEFLEEKVVNKVA